MTDALVAIMACSLIQPVASALTNVITGKGQEGRFFPLLRRTISYRNLENRAYEIAINPKKDGF